MLTAACLLHLLSTYRSKLQTEFAITDKYVEVSVDVGSSAAAAYITGLVRGATKALVIDIGLVLEGQHSYELPEELLGAIRWVCSDDRLLGGVDVYVCGRVGVGYSLFDCRWVVWQACVSSGAMSCSKDKSTPQHRCKLCSCWDPAGAPCQALAPCDHAS
jgi:hypothetical protein